MWSSRGGFYESRAWLSIQIREACNVTNVKHATISGVALQPFAISTSTGSRHRVCTGLETHWPRGSPGSKKSLARWSWIARIDSRNWYVNNRWRRWWYTACRKFTAGDHKDQSKSRKPRRPRLVETWRLVTMAVGVDSHGQRIVRSSLDKLKMDRADSHGWKSHRIRSL